MSGGVRQHWPTVTCGDVAALCQRRGLAIDFLVERFRGAFGDRQGDVVRLENRVTPREFFERVLQGRNADLVIPYASVLTWYERELGLEQLSTGREKRCACGCGQRIWGRKTWASSGCKQRGYRQRGGDPANSPEKPAPLLTPAVTESSDAYPG